MFFRKKVKLEDAEAALVRANNYYAEYRALPNQTVSDRAFKAVLFDRWSDAQEASNKLEREYTQHVLRQDKKNRKK